MVPIEVPIHKYFSEPQHYNPVIGTLKKQAVSALRVQRTEQLGFWVWGSSYVG